ncbi:MAG: hypothetical protein QMD22_07550 [archaeon]|nr:hypothetical protein [archaeon]
MEKKRKEKVFIIGDYNKRNPKNRAIITVSLLLILFLLCAYHQTNYECGAPPHDPASPVRAYHREYPSVKNMVSDYSKYIGETASISGEVVGVPSTTFQLLERYDDKNAIFTVLPDSNVDVDIGDKVEVLGSLGPDYQISAEKIIVLKRWKYEFTFIRSLIALILLVFIFLRNWKFDFKLKLFRKKFYQK